MLPSRIGDILEDLIEFTERTKASSEGVEKFCLHSLIYLKGRGTDAHPETFKCVLYFNRNVMSHVNKAPLN